jgi:hypothetical protein
MFDFKIENLKEMKIVSSDGKNRLDAKKKLEDYLLDIDLSAKKYFYVEVFNKDLVAGAMAIARVDRIPERNRHFRSNTLKEGPYLLLDMTYSQFVQLSKPGTKEQVEYNHYLKENGYKLADIPFFEFLDDNEEQIRLYMRLK